MSKWEWPPWPFSKPWDFGFRNARPIRMDQFSRANHSTSRFLEKPITSFTTYHKSSSQQSTTSQLTEQNTISLLKEVSHQNFVSKASTCICFLEGGRTFFFKSGCRTSGHRLFANTQWSQMAECLPGAASSRCVVSSFAIRELSRRH